VLVADYFGGHVQQLPQADHRGHRANPTRFAEFVRACVDARSPRQADSK
jgi:hypothetical protein